MPGDPQECRLQAEHCLVMAQDSADQENRALLSQMAEQWMRLAKDFENAAAFQEALDAFNLANPPTNSKGDGHDSTVGR